MFEQAKNLDPRTKRPTMHDLAFSQTFEQLTHSPNAAKPKNAVRTRLACLSNREIEVLHHIALGMTSKATANVLNLSVHTVNNHRKNMMAATRVQNMTELVCLAKQARII